ncbi:MAG: glycosyl transferase [Dysgonamonadaceae bacterium]|jgi:mannosyltransferase OCH1-like enzyme|nr:glycosyl transferase [Dysgonamonadaceae bacterium]
MLTFNKNTAILFIVLNKAEITEKVFREIKAIQPKKLYIAIDETLMITGEEGGQQSYLDILSMIEWPCKVHSFTGKGEKTRVKREEQYISWFFDHEEEGIILKDSYLPSQSFWGFCSSLLEKYRDDKRIGFINGENCQNSVKRGDASYYFSSLALTLGWACWKRTWESCKASIKLFPVFEKLECLDKIPSCKPFKKQWTRSLRTAYYANKDFWNLQLIFDSFINNRLCIIPNVNLLLDMSNQTKDKVLSENEILGEIDNLIHSEIILPDIEADIYTQSVKFRIPMPMKETKEPIESVFLKNKLLNLTEDMASFMKIPRIIHQIYEDLAGPPEQLQRIAKSWKKNHPEWEYKFWNKHSIEKFLNTEFPEFVSYYQNFPFNVQRWDAIRYLILYKYGGVYADMDYECIDPLDTLLGDSTCCMGMEPSENAITHNKHMIIGNALMASVPGHNYFKRIIEDMMREKMNLPDHKASIIMETTGPFMTTRVYDEYPDKSDITLLPAELIAPLTLDEVQEVIKGRETKEIENKIELAFAIHYFFGSWVPQTK